MKKTRQNNVRNNKKSTRREEKPFIQEKHSVQLSEDRIEGRNPVIEALKAGREIDKILIQKGERHGSIVKVIASAKERRIVIQEVLKQKLDEISVTGAHQGVIAYTAMHQYVDVEDMLKIASEKGESPFLILADEITDPHNLGSIIRTANAVGAHGVIIPKRRAVGLTAVVAKASAGAIEYVPVAKVTNLSQTIDKLKQEGVWIVGSDIQGTQDYYEADLKGPMGLVIGSEGKGMSRLIKEKCDFLVKIPMIGEIDSLNASVAGAVIMYEVLRQRR